MCQIPFLLKITVLSNPAHSVEIFLCFVVSKLGKGRQVLDLWVLEKVDRLVAVSVFRDECVEFSLGQTTDLDMIRIQMVGHFFIHISKICLGTLGKGNGFLSGIAAAGVAVGEKFAHFWFSFAVRTEAISSRRMLPQSFSAW